MARSLALTLLALLAAAALFAAVAVAHGDHGHHHDEADEAAPAGDTAVQHLTGGAAAFDAFLEANEVALVEFFAPWCGHCKKLAPELEKAAAALKAEGFPILAVDATQDDNRDLGSRYGVKGFPTVLFFRRGATTPSTYQGARTAEAIVEFCRDMQRPASIAVGSDAEFEEATKAHSVLVVGHVAEAAATAFHAVADRLRMSHKFAHLSADDAASSKVVVHLDGAASEEQALDGLDDAALEQWVLKYAAPLIEELGPQNFATRVAQSPNPSVIVFVDLKASDIAETKATLTNVAREVRGRANVLYIDGRQFRSFSKKLGLGDGLPALAVLNPSKNVHFVYEEGAAFTATAISEFVGNVVDGKVEPFVRSDEPPKSNPGPMFDVVRSEFERFVDQSGKDVIMMFYAPWCGHCKKLMPIFEDFAKAASSVKTLTVARFNADTNDVPPGYGLNVRGFPTVYLLPANNYKTPVQFEGDRTFEGILEFVAENASHKFDASAIKAPVEEEADDDDDE